MINIIGKRLLSRFHALGTKESVMTTMASSLIAISDNCIRLPLNVIQSSFIISKRFNRSFSAHQQCLIVPSRSKPNSTVDRSHLIPKRFCSNNSNNNNNPPEEMAPISKIRQNYHEESEAGVNKQINLELYAAYVYQQMAYHFNRTDIALSGFERFFYESSKEERVHAEKLMMFQNQRGGRIVLQDIPKPIKQDWSCGLEAMEAALELEKTVNQSLLDLHDIAAKHNDAHFAEFLESEFLNEQVDAIKKLSDFVTNLRRVGHGLGEYIFDKETLQPH
nr:allergen [Blomia tropicalis]